MIESSRFFAKTLQSRDAVIASEIVLELRRQQTQFELIASEHMVSSAIDRVRHLHSQFPTYAHAEAPV